MQTTFRRCPTLDTLQFTTCHYKALTSLTFFNNTPAALLHLLSSAWITYENPGLMKPFHLLFIHRGRTCTLSVLFCWVGHRPASSCKSEVGLGSKIKVIWQHWLWKFYELYCMYEIYINLENGRSLIEIGTQHVLNYYNNLVELTKILSVLCNWPYSHGGDQSLSTLY